MKKKKPQYFFFNETLFFYITKSKNITKIKKYVQGLIVLHFIYADKKSVQFGSQCSEKF